ncbi:insulinase family protein [Burkholderiaceae bacterium DAT-1]|nr:insulinase family protein [Burkholderiaceae bacterium DAT-1]
MRMKPAALMVLAAMQMLMNVQAADAAVPAPSAPVATNVAAAPVQVTRVEGINEFRLSNGLRVLLAPDASKPTTTVNVTYMVGSRHESYGETGMAHLLEHLVFKGTPSLPGKTIVQEFAKRGMRYNGTTFFDRTNYFETFAASDDNLDWALKMEADRMVNSNVWRSDLDTEMTVVRNEMEMGENNPGRILFEKMTAAAYQWHNYGKSTIGARTDVENVNIDHLQAFYRKYYQPDNAVLIVTGKFDEAKTLARINEYFGSIAKPARTIEKLWTLDPVQDGAREINIARVGDASLIGALYHVPQGSAADFAAVSALSQILGDTPNGRLYKALVEKKKAAGVEGEALALHDPGFMVLFAQLGKGQSRDEARRILLDVVEGIKKQPITEAEVKRAKTALLNQLDKTLSDPVRFGVSLSEAIAQGDWRLFFVERDRIEALTAADVQRAAENYLIESNRTFGQFIPTEKPVRAQFAAAPDVAALVKDYKGKAEQSAGEAFDPSPLNIEKRTVRFDLPNGAKVAFLTKQTRGNTVNGQIVLRIGDEKGLFGKKYVAEATASMLKRGAGKMSRQEIADKLDELKAKVAVADRLGSAVIVGFDTRRAQLPELIALLKDILRAPSFPEAELDRLKTEWITTIEEQRRQPDAIANNELGRSTQIWKKGDIRFTDSFDDQIAAIKAIKVADIKAFYQQFYGAASAQIALSGDFDAQSVRDDLKAAFGDWKAKSKFTRVADPFVATKAKELKYETPDKANANFLAALTIPLRDDSPETPALQIANRVFGGGGLKSRLADRLRQKEGISYGSGSGLSLNPHDANAVLFMYAIFAPQNLPKLQAGVKEELDRLIKDGITEQELAESKSGLLQSAQIGRTQDASLAAALANQLYVGRTMQYTADQEDKLKAVTVEQVNAVIRKYFKPEALVQVVAGDFANAAKKAEAADKK